MIKNDSETYYKITIEGEDFHDLICMAKFAEEMTILWDNFPDSIKNKYRQDKETLDEIRKYAIRLGNIEDSHSYIL